MNNNKKIIIAAGIFFSAILLGLSVIHIAVNFMYPGNELAESIKENFKDSFGKSIKFDSMVFRYNGDIILQNFYLSNTTDFNDNVNLIKCSEVIIDTSLLDLLREKITFSSVVMYEPEINIIKNYGKTYTDIIIDDIISGIQQEKIEKFITDRFTIELNNARLYYREIFKKTKTSVDFYDVDIYVRYSSKKLKYSFDGKIDNRNSNLKTSRFDAEGILTFSSRSSENRLRFKNIDLSVANNFLSENFENPLSLTGELSGDIRFRTGDDKMYLTAGLEGEKISAISGDRYILKNENITLKSNSEASSSMETIKINSLSIDDNVFKISINSEFVKGEIFSCEVTSNRIDLSELSGKINPVKGCSYNGELLFSFKIKYNLKDMMPDDIAIDLKLDYFNLIPDETANSKFKDIKNCNALISADREKFLVKTKLSTGRSDLDISFNGAVSEWNPFRSKSLLEITSEKLEIELLKKAVIKCVTAVYEMAYVDMFQNFDEQRNFLKEPEGVFINNNDLSLKFKSDKVLLNNNSALNNLNLEVILDKGTLKTENFTLEGYEGIFNFNAYAILRQDYPYFKFEGGVENLNLTQVAADSGSDINYGGILSSDFKFETNAFRVGQIVENGRAAFNLKITDGMLSVDEKLSRLNNFIKTNGFKEALPEPLTFSNLNFSFMQSANSYYIKNFTMSGRNCSFSAYGKYIEDEGLNIPVNLNMNVKNTYTKIPLLIHGDLLSPCVKINEKNKKESLCF